MAATPVSISCKQAAEAPHVRGRPNASPRSCSGAMYASVPSAAPLRLASAGSCTFATPKSSTFTVPERVTIRLAGLMSRWMIRCWCACASACAACTATSSACCRSERALLQQPGQRLPLDVLDDEVIEFVLASDVEQGADVGMVQPRNEMGLAIEPCAEVRRRTQGAATRPSRRRCAIQAGVSRLVHLSHAANAQQGKDFVRA